MDLRQHGHNFVPPNIKYDFNKCHFIAHSLFLLCSNFMSSCYLYVYVLYQLFFNDNVVHLLSSVNICPRHVYFTINSLTYLHTQAHNHTPPTLQCCPTVGQFEHTPIRAPLTAALARQHNKQTPI